MNIAIVDDIPDETAEVKALLKEYAAVNRLEMKTSVFSSAEEFLKTYRPLLYTVIFMDIFMDGMTGVQAAEQIRSKDASVILIFLTTSEEHRADAFHCHAYDYLIKPVRQEALFHTMDDILRIKTELNTRVFFFSSQRRDYSLPYADIVFVRTESNGSNYLEIMDSAGNTYRTRMTFSSVCDTLNEDNRFLLLQSGVLVNMEHIVRLKEKTCILDSGGGLPFAVRREKEIKQIWQNYMFEHIRNSAMRR